MFTRILVPTDFSEPSDAALLYATELAARFGATIHLVHVVEDPIVTGAFGVEAYAPESPGMSAALRADAEFRLNERLNDITRAGVRATCEVLNGPSAPTIVNAAGELAIDLIVMGTHGRMGMAHAIMGSVAERVVRVAPCPVLTVHMKPQPQVSAVPVHARAVVVV
jgi:nucleotide-binding universal stress UspA family protein